MQVSAQRYEPIAKLGTDAAHLLLVVLKAVVDFWLFVRIELRRPRMRG